MKKRVTLADILTEIGRFRNELGLETAGVRTDLGASIEAVMTELVATRAFMGERFDRVEATLAEHSATLAEHSATLAEHSATLAEHSATLAQHSQSLNRLERRADSHGSRIETLEQR
ncbi:MAG: hypothetical protein NVS2B17_29460 [Candidatus Velthaea sp.]